MATDIDHNYNAALIYAKAFGFLCPDGYGVVIHLEGDIKNPFSIGSKLLVARRGTQTSVEDCPEEAKEGSVIQLIR